jgi:hypothetical protein
MIRLVPNHISQIVRTEDVEFTFDNKTYRGHLGESLVAALTRNGVLELRTAPDHEGSKEQPSLRRQGGSRGAFCCMGLCQECAVRINNCVVEACLTDIEPGLIIERIS